MKHKEVTFPHSLCVVCYYPMLQLTTIIIYRYLLPSSSIATYYHHHLSLLTTIIIYRILRYSWHIHPSITRFKLATTERRNIFVNHTDPSARDPNGYLVGSYYVSVYGWCTPDAFVSDPMYDGPCSYAAKTLFNVTVDIIPRSKSML
jgi:hypothetical protein